MAFSVNKLLEYLDLQASVLVGSDVYDENHLANHIHPDRGLRLVGALWCYVQTHKVNLNLWHTNVNDNLPRSFYQ